MPGLVVVLVVVVLLAAVAAVAAALAGVPLVFHVVIALGVGILAALVVAVYKAVSRGR